MADLSHVQNALAGIIAGAVYPNGIGQAPVFNVPTVRIYPGWPQSAQLDKDLRQGFVNISIYGMQMERNTTRYMREWREVSRAAATLIATVAGFAVTLSGTVSVPQNIAATVKGVDYVYALQSNDTLASIATGLAALINVDTPATSLGATFTANGLSAVRIGTDGRLAREIRRQEKQFMISIWAPKNDVRIAAAMAVDNAISPIDQLALADGSFGRITYVRSTDNDDPQEALLYRRDIVFNIDYPTLEFADGTSVVSSTVAVDPVNAIAGH